MSKTYMPPVSIRCCRGDRLLQYSQISSTDVIHPFWFHWHNLFKHRVLLTVYLSTWRCPTRGWQIWKSQGIEEFKRGRSPAPWLCIRSPSRHLCNSCRWPKSKCPWSRYHLRIFTVMICAMVLKPTWTTVAWKSRQSSGVWRQSWNVINRFPLDPFSCHDDIRYFVMLQFLPATITHHPTCECSSSELSGYTIVLAAISQLGGFHKCGYP